ncbi:MAG: WYL domain-containing protein [Anaerolineae bacterium]|nr:WYL domain-containing protein [Anaerolineae bacterium]
MKKSTAHARRSQWDVLERCLAILQRLLRAPASSDELLRIIWEKAEEAEEKLSRSAALKRFEEDRRRLRETFGCDIQFERSTELYVLRGMDRALIDLADVSLRGLAFLQTTFNSPEAVMREDVQSLLDQILMLISSRRRRDLVRERGLLEVNLQPRDQDEILDGVWESVRTACGEHRQLEFHYVSPKQDDGMARTHLVEPIRYFFDPVRAHYYLEAYWLESSGPKGRHLQNFVQLFRLGRIQDPQVLPRHFVPNRRSLPKHELVYELTAEVARLGVTRHFMDQQDFPQPDGSAIVKVQSHNLFFDLRTLLHYGPNCRVIGGEEARKQMQLLVEGMWRRYEA